MSLLRMSLTGGVMILAVMVLRALLINRLPKKTFLALWALALCRLLIPLEVPSPLSVYNTTPAAAVAVRETVRNLPGAGDILGVPRFVSPELAGGMAGGSPLGGGALFPALWLFGALACAFFFLAAWVHCRRRFSDALPAAGPIADVWSSLYHGRAVALKVSDRVAAPLTYGIARPVVLLPKGAAWETEEKLRYVLAHEAVHIGRLDGLWKLVLTGALCLHWWNPLVWAMYLLANRDLELSCDETVVRAFGQGAKSSYAMTLIGMEAKQSGLLPFTSAFSKSAIEQRVRAVMKMKKTTALAVAAALMVVAAVGIGLATSAQQTRSDAQERYPDLMAMRFDGYEDMTINEYRGRVIEVIAPWDGTDRDFAHQIDRMTSDEAIREAQNTDTDAWFLMNTLRLSMMDGWRGHTLSSGAVIDGVEVNIDFRYAVEDPAKLTVGERDRVLRGYLVDGVAELARQFQAGGKVTIEEELAGRYHAEGLTISDLNYVAYQMEWTPDEAAAADPSVDEPQEPRGFPNTTAADYERILALMTDGYGEETVEDFNRNLLRHMNDAPGFYDSYWGVWEDLRRGEGSYDLTDTQRTFLLLTLDASNTENAALVRTEAGYPTQPQYSLPEYWRTADGVQLRAELKVEYQITDGTQVTVARRDAALSGVLGGMKEFLDRLSGEEIKALDRAALAEKFNLLLGEYTTPNLVLEPIEKEAFFFEVYLLDTGVSESPMVTPEIIRVQYYDDGSPYLHYAWKNRSEKTVTGLQFSLLAYDSEGDPLKLHWNMLDSGAGTSYENLVESQVTIAPGQIDDTPGGWSLESPTSVHQALACVIWADFEDGSTWVNPEYESWRTRYLGRRLSAWDM